MMAGLVRESESDPFHADLAVTSQGHHITEPNGPSRRYTPGRSSDGFPSRHRSRYPGKCARNRSSSAFARRKGQRASTGQTNFGEIISSNIGTLHLANQNFRRECLGIYTNVNIENPFGKRLQQDGPSIRSGAARLREFRERGFAALAQSVESLGAGDPARALETVARLAPLSAHGEQLAAVEVDARDGHAVSAQLPVRRRGLQQRGGAAGAPESGRAKAGRFRMRTAIGGLSPACKNLNIDFGEKDAGEGRLSAVAGGVARGNRTLYETDALGDAPGFDERDAARTFEHTVERAQALKLDVERLELRKSFSARGRTGLRRSF